MAKGKSSIQQKAEYQRRQPYTPQQRMNYESCDCDFKARMPPQAVLDKIAEEKLTGRYNVRKSNICQKCFTAKSVNGSCGCPKE